jgi:hypothetical protein
VVDAAEATTITGAAARAISGWLVLELSGFGINSDRGGNEGGNSCTCGGKSIFLVRDTSVGTSTGVSAFPACPSTAGTDASSSPPLLPPSIPSEPASPVALGVKVVALDPLEPLLVALRTLESFFHIDDIQSNNKYAESMLDPKLGRNVYVNHTQLAQQL